MFVDCHTHLGGSDDARAQRVWKESRRIPDWVSEPYLKAMATVDRAILAAAPWEPTGIAGNEGVASFALDNPIVVPFLVIQPDSETVFADLDFAVHELGAKGIKLGPIYQHFRPDDERYFPVYEAIQRRGLPILWHQGSSLMAVRGPLEWANPVLLDKVARTFPELRMVIAHLGFPWVRETVALVRKQPYVFTDISALRERTWVLYNGLVDLVQYGGIEKVFFGTDFPWYTPAEMETGLCEVAAMSKGTNLPSLTEDVVQGILHRNCLEILGIQ